MTSAASIPQRVVSLVPSLTETLFALDCGDRLVGRTRYCVKPEAKMEAVAVVGGVVDPDLDRIAGLQPDLVVVSEEETPPAVIHQLRSQSLHLFVASVRTVADAARCLDALGGVLGAVETAQRLSNNVIASRDRIRKRSAHLKRLLVAYVVWPDPVMVAGSETYVGDVMRMCAAESPFDDPRSRYPTVQVDDITKARVEAILLPSEPFPFTHTDVARWTRLFSGGSPAPVVRLVDGEDFCWYGVRTMTGLENAFLVLEECRAR